MLSVYGRLAQLGERLVYTQEVGGSSPSPPIAGRRARSRPDCRAVVDGIHLSRPGLPRELLLSLRPTHTHASAGIRMPGCVGARERPSLTFGPGGDPNAQALVTRPACTT